MNAQDRRALARASIRPWRNWRYEIARWFFVGIYKAYGWKVLDALPPDRKMVVIAAPHATNWDLVFMLGIAFYYRMPVRWMGKKTLGEGPFGWLMHWWGLLPVDRDKSTSVVEQVIAAYQAADEMCVVLAPEGTRRDVPRWKTGFYNIALGAKVPIGIGFIDYESKTGGVTGPIQASGNFDFDMIEIIKRYRDLVPGFKTPSLSPPSEH